MRSGRSHIQKVSGRRRISLGLFLQWLGVVVCFVGMVGCQTDSGSGSIITKAPPSNGPSVQQCSATIKAFIAQGRFKVNLDANDHGDHGVICVLGEDGKLSLTILNNTPGQKREKLPPFESDFGRKPTAVEVYRDAAPIPLAPADPDTGAGASAPQVQALIVRPPPVIAAGSPAKGAGMSVSGTLGWNIIFNGQLVCLSNHHVLSNKPNPPTIGAGVVLNALQAAKLYRYNPMQFSLGAQQPVNYWDLALGAYNVNSSAGAFMVGCQGGSQYSYPTSLTPCGSVATGQSFHFIGAASGCQNAMPLVGICYGTVKIYNKNTWFEDQLIFPLRTAGRDSGAIIIRDSDNTVAGLHMAIVQLGGKTWYSISNPLYRVQWANTGMTTVAGNAAAFPSFTPVFAVPVPYCFGGPPCPE